MTINNAQEAAQQLLTHLETIVAPPFTDGDGSWWDYQPSAVEEFYTAVTQALELMDAPGRFLDVGSGIGAKLFLADAMGFTVAGVERYAPYVETSQRLYPDLPVSCANAEEFTAYAGFALVHCNGLAHDLDRQQRINRHIMARMTPGALYLFTSVPGPDWVQPVAHQVWRA